MNIKGQGHLLTLVQGQSDSNFSSLETTRPTEAKFQVEPPWDGETKAFVQMVLVTLPVWPPCPICGKNLKNYSSLEPKSWWPWKLVKSIGYSSTTKIVQMMTLGWPWPILRQCQIWSIMLLYGKKVKQWTFSETFVVYDIKVGRCS